MVPHSVCLQELLKCDRCFILSTHRCFTPATAILRVDQMACPQEEGHSSVTGIEQTGCGVPDTVATGVISELLDVSHSTAKAASGEKQRLAGLIPRSRPQHHACSR